MSEFLSVLLMSQTVSHSVTDACVCISPWNDVCRVATFDHVTLYLSAGGGERRSGLCLSTAATTTTTTTTATTATTATTPLT